MKYRLPTGAVPAVLCLCLLTKPAFAASDDILQLSTPDDTELQVRKSGNNDTILIYFPAPSSPARQNKQLAQAMVKKGFQVWTVNPIEDRFLPDTASSYYALPASDFSQIITAANQQTTRPKKVYLLGSGRAAVPMLLGARLWQQQHPEQTLGGLVFISPYLYRETPEPGQEAQLLPIALNTNMPIYILQPDLSPRYWQLRSTMDGLQSGGSVVFARILRQLRGRFEYRPDATEYEIRQAMRLPDYIQQAIKALDFLPATARKQTQIQLQHQPLAATKKERTLAPYNGNPKPPRLALNTLSGEQRQIGKGKVTLINFWASWCPPCVHEMPSMERLNQQLTGEPFEILGINMAESPQTIRRFLTDKVQVSFPILLDSDGEALRQWRVYAFPTSFLLDKNGKIRYALFGSIEWDTPTVMRKIRSLLDE